MKDLNIALYDLMLAATWSWLQIEVKVTLIFMCFFVIVSGPAVKC